MRARGGIVIVIAHRPSLLAAVDHLLVLNEGRMQAFGRTEAVLPLLTPKPAVAVAEPAAEPAETMRAVQTKTSAGRREPPGQSIRVMIAVALAAGSLVGGIGVWARLTDMAGRVIAPGSLVVESSVKKVQHPTGGVAGELRVKEGGRVKPGTISVRLDETVAQRKPRRVTKSLGK